MNIPENSLSVKSFIAVCREQLALALGPRVYVFGRISKVNQRNPNLFIELADMEEKNVAMTCFLTATAKQRVVAALEKGKFQLSTDLPVLLFGSVGVFGRNGSLYLNVDGCVVEFTTGKLVAERDKTNERLKKEGLFDLNREKLLPFLPRKLLLLTSSAGTVINDFISGLETAQFGFKLLWYEVPMQGVSAKKEVLKALVELPQMCKPDAILLFRGGGSNTELALFNDYDIARAICLCPVAVLSAIGHQADMSSAQDVSYLSLGVPKELGLFFANIVLEFRSRLDNNLSVITSLSHERLTRFDERLKATKQQIRSALSSRINFAESMLKVSKQGIFNFSREFIKAQQIRLEGVLYRLQRISDLVLRNEEKIKHFEQLAAEADPQRQLERGFSVIFESEAGTSVKTVASLQAGKQVNIRVSDGTVENVRINRER
jgi:exodeoxyribonuclease VII large subunit